MKTTNEKPKQENIVKAVAYLLGAIGTALLIMFGLSSCGVTRATISNPRDGSQTTITITTNNPISTKVDPTVNAEFVPLK